MGDLGEGPLMRPHHLILPILSAGLVWIGVPNSGAVQANLDLRATHDVHVAGGESHLNPSSSVGSLRSATNDGTNYYAFCMNGGASGDHNAGGQSRESHGIDASSVVRVHGHGDESLSGNGRGSSGSTHEGIGSAVASHGGEHNGRNTGQGPVKFWQC